MTIPPDKLRSWIASGSLRTELEEFIQSESVYLSLDKHCTQGGSPGEVEISDLSHEHNPAVDFISGDFDVWFSESYYNGCRGIEWSQKHSGNMSFEVDLSSGLLTITQSEISRVPDGNSDDDEDPDEQPGNA